MNHNSARQGPPRAAAPERKRALTSLWEIISTLQAFGADDAHIVRLVSGMARRGYLRPAPGPTAAAPAPALAGMA